MLDKQVQNSNLSLGKAFFDLGLDFPSDQVAAFGLTGESAVRDKNVLIDDMTLEDHDCLQLLLPRHDELMDGVV